MLLPDLQLSLCRPSWVLVSAGSDIAIGAGRDLTITSAANSSESAFRAKRHKGNESQITQVQSQLTAEGDVTLSAGNDLTVRASTVDAAGNLALAASGDTRIEAAQDEFSSYERKHKKSTFKRTTTTIEEHTSRNVGSSLNSGGSVTFNAILTDQGVGLVDSGSVAIVGSDIRADEQVVINAGEGITLDAGFELNEYFKRVKKKGFAGLSGSSRTNITEQQTTLGTAIVGGDSVALISGGDTNVLASAIASDANIQVQAGRSGSGDVNIVNKVETVRSVESSSSYGFLQGGNFFEAESQSEETVTQRVAGSSLTAAGVVSLTGADSVNIIGSDVHGDTGVNLNAQRGDITIAAAAATTTANSESESVELGLPDLRELVSDDSGRLRINLASGDYEASESDVTRTEFTGSTVTSHGSVTADAGGNIAIIGSEVLADLDGSGEGAVNLMADGDISIVEAVNTVTERTETTDAEAKLNVVVQNEYVETAKMALAVVEATQALDDAVDAYNQHKSDLKALQARLTELEDAYANKQPGVSRSDLTQLTALINDMKGDEAWHQAGIAAATVSLATLTAGAVQQVATAGASSATYGFNAGIELAAQGSKSEQQSVSTQSVGSSVSGAQINAVSGNGGANTSTFAVSGSDLRAGEINISTGNLEVSASQDTVSSQSSQDGFSASAQQTFWGAAAGGPSVNIGISTGNSRSSSTTHTNSVITADAINLAVANDASFNGATVTAMQAFNAEIGGDLSVESVQDTASSRSNNFSASAGLSFGGKTTDHVGSRGVYQTSAVGKANGVGGVSGSLGQGSGYELSQNTVLTSITSGGTADVTVDGGTEIVGAVLATVDDQGNDLGQLRLNTGSLTVEDLKDSYLSRETGFSVSAYVSVGGDSAAGDDPGSRSQSDGQGGDQRLDTVGVSATNNNAISLSTVMGTLGEGDITVDGDSDPDLSGINRDVAETELELFAVDRTSGVNLQLDTRFLTEEGREEIKEDVKAVPENIQHLDEMLPSAESDNQVEAALGKALDLLGKATLGVTPSSGNHGGLIAQVPILMGANDTEQVTLLVAPKKYVANPEQWQPASELPGYDKLSDAQKQLMEGMVVAATRSAPRNETETTLQNFVNGILNSPAAAVANAANQTTSGDAPTTVQYNPTHGALGDLLESGVDLVFKGKDGRPVTGIAKQTGTAMEQTVSNRDGNPTNFYNHSQGNAVAQAGLNTTDFDAMRLQMAGGDEARAESLAREHEESVEFHANGSPVNNVSMRDSARDAGFTLGSSRSNPGDPVGEGIGGNKGDYVDSSLATTLPNASTEPGKSGMFTRGVDSVKGAFGLVKGSDAHGNYPCVGEACAGDTKEGSLQIPGGSNQGVNTNAELPVHRPGRPDNDNLLTTPDLPSRPQGEAGSGVGSGNPASRVTVPFVSPELTGDDLSIEQKIEATRAQEPYLDFFQVRPNAESFSQQGEANE